MDLGGDLVEGVFLERVNRFLARVEVDGQEVGVHVANSGRMKELFVPGWRVLVRPAIGEHRKTKFDLVLVDMGSALASTDARMPNALVAEGVANGHLQQFADYPEIRREVTFGDSRLDLMLEGPGGRCYIEAKSVTLVEKGVGLFPDAPTVRGAKHLRTTNLSPTASSEKRFHPSVPVPIKSNDLHGHWDGMRPTNTTFDFSDYFCKPPETPVLESTVLAGQCKLSVKAIIWKLSQRSQILF